jgi:flagellar biosynthesis protein FliP
MHPETQKPKQKNEIYKALKFWGFAFAIGFLGTFLGVASAFAQSVNVNLGDGTGLTERVVQTIALLTILSLAPSVVIMTTSFVRIVVVLSLLRTAMGLQQSPPNAVIISLALFLTAFVMGPTFEKSWNQGIAPLTKKELTLEQAWPQATQPLKVFMLAQTREVDLGLFVKLGRVPRPQNAVDLPMRIVTPAFMISELRRGFEIGFLLFVPFLVIDLVVSSILMAMGMMMLPPAVVSLPFKLIFFVLVDGWRLVSESLVQSFKIP